MYTIKLHIRVSILDDDYNLNHIVKKIVLKLYCFCNESEKSKYISTKMSELTEKNHGLAPN